MRNIFSRIEKIDKKMSEYFAVTRKAWLKNIFTLITHLGDGIFWLLIYLCMFIFFYGSVGEMLHTLLFAELMGLLIIISLRYLTRRERPAMQFQQRIAWDKYSFPSHHALSCRHAVSRTQESIGTIIPVSSPKPSLHNS